jgi:hypothetical protein
MTFLCLSRVLINTAHIVAILTDGGEYTIQTSRTYASQYGGAAAGNLSYSYPEHFRVPKESADGAVIRSWIACQTFQPWPNAKQQSKQQRKILRKQKAVAEPQEPKAPQEPQVARAPEPAEEPKAPQPPQAMPKTFEEVNALLEDSALPRHASAALRRLNEHLRNSPGGSPSLSRSASPFRALKASIAPPQ